MISNGIINLGRGLMDVLFSLGGVLPNFSPDVVNVIDKFFAFMFGGINLLSIFIDMNMVKILIPFVIGILNFDKIIKVLMFILKKIPIIDIH